ncbi:hypothetical protein [Agrobacterium sp. MCAB5]|uniref:hypothetical protein n=1 Tax=Agrobacterium sp. MCAB5 TaxID=3233042 RepID=UPI003F93E96D
MKMKPPIDIHESVIEQHYARKPGGEVESDAAIAALASAIRQTRLNSASLAEYAETITADKLIPPEAARLRIRDQAIRLAEVTARKLDEAKNRVQKEIEDIESLTGAPPVLRDQISASLETEIRARLSVMPDKERDDAIGKAFTKNDLAVVAAVLRGPALLVGMSQTKQDMVRHRYRNTFYPEETARRRRLQEALEATERGGQSFIKFITAATTGAAAQLAAASERAKAAEKVMEAAIGKQE